MPRKLLIVRRKGKLKVKSRSVLQLLCASGTGKRVVREFPIRDLDAVLIIGRDTYVESGALSVLASMNVPVAVIAKGGVGVMMNPAVVITPYYRVRQYRLEKERMLDIALEFIKAKIKGMCNIIKYYRSEAPEIQPPERREDVREYELSIRTWESTASHALWGRLVELIKPELLEMLRSEYGFNGRRPKHPDPFNKTLSVMYAVLYSLATKALIAAGLDPTYGLLHRTRYGTPLTYDYTEMFKPIAMEATITLINNEGLPELDEDGELKRDWISKTINKLYKYLTLKHKDTGKTPYQQIHLKAFCLAKHLEGRHRKDRLTVTWDRRQYRHPKR